MWKIRQQHCYILNYLLLRPLVYCRSIKTSTCTSEQHILVVITVPGVGWVTTRFPIFVITLHITQCDIKSILVISLIKITFSPVCCLFVSHFSADSTSRVVTKVTSTHSAPLVEQQSSLTWWCIITWLTNQAEQVVTFNCFICKVSNINIFNDTLFEGYK